MKNERIEPTLYSLSQMNNAYIAWTVNVVCVCIPFQQIEMYCILDTIFFFRFSSTFNGLIMRVYDHKRWFRILFILYTIHHTPYHQLWTPWKTVATIICDVCTWNAFEMERFQAKYLHGVFRAHTTCMRFRLRICSGTEYIIV